MQDNEPKAIRWYARHKTNPNDIKRIEREGKKPRERKQKQSHLQFKSKNKFAYKEESRFPSCKHWIMILLLNILEIELKFTGASHYMSLRAPKSKKYLADIRESTIQKNTHQYFMVP